MKLSGYEICETVIQNLKSKYTAGQLKVMAKNPAKSPKAIALKRAATIASKSKK